LYDGKTSSRNVFSPARSMTIARCVGLLSRTSDRSICEKTYVAFVGSPLGEVSSRNGA